jgi:hypothetical protein
VRRAAENDRARARNLERLPFPDDGPILVDDAAGREDRPGLDTPDQRAREPERDERAFGERERGAEADPGDAATTFSRRALLRGERADEN